MPSIRPPPTAPDAFRLAARSSSRFCNAFADRFLAMNILCCRRFSWAWCCRSFSTLSRWISASSSSAVLADVLPLPPSSSSLTPTVCDASSSPWDCFCCCCFSSFFFFSRSANLEAAFPPVLERTSSALRLLVVVNSFLPSSQSLVVYYPYQ